MKRYSLLFVKWTIWNNHYERKAARRNLTKCIMKFTSNCIGLVFTLIVTYIIHVIWKIYYIGNLISFKLKMNLKFFIIKSLIIFIRCSWKEEPNYVGRFITCMFVCLRPLWGVNVHLSNKNLNIEDMILYSFNTHSVQIKYFIYLNSILISNIFHLTWFFERISWITRSILKINLIIFIFKIMDLKL